MHTRRAALIALALVAFVNVPAKKENKPILIAIAADWCPTCKAQEPILSNLLSDGAFMNMVAFRVDFDAQKDVVRAFGAQSQSTLIVFTGEKKVGRSVADTDAASIEALMRGAL